MDRLIGTYIFDPEISAGKMIFLAGPRQVGKTTFAKNWLASSKTQDTYLTGMIRRSGKNTAGTPSFFGISSLPKPAANRCPWCSMKSTSTKLENILKGFTIPTGKTFNCWSPGVRVLGTIGNRGCTRGALFFVSDVSPGASRGRRPVFLGIER